jgi:ribonuclease J
MNERRKLAFQGIVSVAVPLNSANRLAGAVEISLHGLPVEEDRDAFLEETCAAAADAAKRSKGDKLREDVRLAVRRCATDWTGKKPVVDVLVVRV